jgi:hypothetical protein
LIHYGFKSLKTRLLISAEIVARDQFISTFFSLPGKRDTNALNPVPLPLNFTHDCGKFNQLKFLNKEILNSLKVFETSPDKTIRDIIRMFKESLDGKTRFLFESFLEKLRSEYEEFIPPL